MASVYTHRNFYTETLLHTEKLLHTKSFTHSKLLQKKKLHREAFLYIITTGIAAPKPDLEAKAKKKTILKRFLKGILKGEKIR